MRQASMAMSCVAAKNATHEREQRDARDALRGIAEREIGKTEHEAELRHQHPRAPPA